VRRKLRSGALAAAIAVAALAQVVGVQAVRADASGHASCIGIEASAISPPGSSDEFPGGLPEVLADVKAAARELGIPPGAILSFVAKLHAGSHVDCDKATG
jgi:hypothetical protein